MRKGSGIGRSRQSSFSISARSLHSHSHVARTNLLHGAPVNHSHALWLAGPQHRRQRCLQDFAAVFETLCLVVLARDVLPMAHERLQRQLCRSAAPHPAKLHPQPVLQIRSDICRRIMKDLPQQLAE